MPLESAYENCVFFKKKKKKSDKDEELYRRQITRPL